MWVKNSFSKGGNKRASFSKGGNRREIFPKEGNRREILPKEGNRKGNLISAVRRIPLRLFRGILMI